MSPRPHRFIAVNTGSSALSCGLLIAIAAIAMAIGLAHYDLMRPVDHSMLKFHSQGDRVS